MSTEPCQSGATTENVNANAKTVKLNPSPIYLFGWGIFQPRCLQQVMNNAKAFLVLLTLANTMQGVIINGLLKLSITSIERRFNLLSSESGLIVSGYDIAGCLTLLPISYLGGKGHKPRWIGIGLILTSLGSLVLALPHFLTGPYEYKEGIPASWLNDSENNTTRITMCHADYVPSNKEDYANPIKDECEMRQRILGPYFSINQMKYVFLFGQLLSGIGCTPLAVLAVTFIDESVDPQVYPVYIGIYYMGSLIGPACGFILGGQLLKIFTEIGVTPDDIVPESPQWVGAWWLGFVISAVILFIIAIPVLGFPRKLPSTLTRKSTMINIKGIYSSQSEGILSTLGGNGKSTTSANDDEPYCQLKYGNEEHIDQTIPLQLPIPQLPDEDPEVDVEIQGSEDGCRSCDIVKKFFSDLLEVITHKAFLYLSIAAAVLGTLVSGFSTFGPKCIESQFGKSASEAANLFGYVCIPAGAGGMLVGGFLMTGLKLSYKSSLRMCFCMSIVGLFALFSLTLHCDDVPMAGVNVPYAGQSSDAPLQPQLPVHPCNENCSCKINSFAPVCGFDGVTYYSSCFAGCKLHVASNGEKIFSNCTCIPPMQKNNNSNHVITEGKAYPGKCFKICWWQNLILVGLFFVIGTTFMCAVPGVDLSLRCFPQHLRSLAVGVQWILIRTLGTIPGPIIFGAMIDSTCQIWNKRDLCAEGLGSCVMYKNQELSFSLLILSVIYKGASILFFGLALLSYKPARLVATESSPSHHRVTESPM